MRLVFDMKRFLEQEVGAYASGQPATEFPAQRKRRREFMFRWLTSNALYLPA